MAQLGRRDTLIVFDVGGVFIDLDTDSRRTALEAGGLWSASSVPDAELLEANAQFRLGRIDEETYLARVSRIYGLTKEQVLSAETALLAGTFDDMVRYAQTLRATHRVVCLSNTQALHWRHIIEQMLGPDLFDACYLSQEMGMEKPADDIYLSLQAQEDVDAGQIVFIDDTLENIHTARRLGWHGIHHGHSAQTIANIDRLLGRRQAAHQH